MQLILKDGVTEEERKDFRKKISALNLLSFSILDGKNHKITIPSCSKKEIELLDNKDLVEDIITISQSYKLASRSAKQSDTIVDVEGVKIGGEKSCIMAGPCAVESLEQVLSIAKDLSEAGVEIFRAGAFKPRSSPYSFQGLGRTGLEYLSKVKQQFGMKIVTEVINIETLNEVAEVADILQVGSRNMQNFDLLKAVGKTQKPILLKRGMSATVEDFLMSAEYILAQGNNQVILCERGIRTFETATRNTLDLNAVPLLKKMTHLPVIVDPSHGTGIRELVAPMAFAGIAAGAHGIMVEVHNNPDEALSDGMQSLTPDQFKAMYNTIKKIKSVLA